MNYTPFSLPSAVIKMEGGTDHDLRILDMPSEEEENREKSISVSVGSEPPKREDLKTLDADRKPSVEKDKNEKVCFVSLGQALRISCCCNDDSHLCHRRRAILQTQKMWPQQKERMWKRRQRKKLPKKKYLKPRRSVLLLLSNSAANERKTWNKYSSSFNSREERGSAVETVMMKAAPQRATLTLIQTPTPTAQTNLWRRKRWKTRMRRKRKVKVRNLTLKVFTEVENQVFYFQWLFNIVHVPRSHKS